MAREHATQREVVVGRLDGKVALVTGGARGIGAADVRRFVAEGAQVLVTDVLDGEGAALVDELGDAAAYRRLDVTDPAAWTEAVDDATGRFGHLDVLANNAGIMFAGTLEATALDDYRRVVEVNQIGVFLGMQAVAPAMRAAGGGSIVNTSSLAGLAGYSTVFAYVASKWAVRGMTKAAALELGHDGIRVNSIHPGAIDTPMIHDPSLPEGAIDELFATQPIPRVGRPEEVAALVTFLASDESSYCTGHEYVIDGGSLAGQALGSQD